MSWIKVKENSDFLTVSHLGFSDGNVCVIQQKNPWFWKQALDARADEISIFLQFSDKLACCHFHAINT
jgi:hypothetical protein